MREEAIMLLRKFYIQENEKGLAVFRVRMSRILTTWKLQPRDRRRIVNCEQTLILPQNPVMGSPRSENVVLSQGRFVKCSIQTIDGRCLQGIT